MAARRTATFSTVPTDSSRKASSSPSRSKPIDAWTGCGGSASRRLPGAVHTPAHPVPRACRKVPVRMLRWQDAARPTRGCRAPAGSGREPPGADRSEWREWPSASITRQICSGDSAGSGTRPYPARNRVADRALGWLPASRFRSTSPCATGSSASARSPSAAPTLRVPRCSSLQRGRYRQGGRVRRCPGAMTRERTPLVLLLHIVVASGDRVKFSNRAAESVTA